MANRFELVIDAVVVGAYFSLMLLVGWRLRHQSAESYWVAGRASGTGATFASLVATVFGASSTLGIMGLGYSRGLTGAWWCLTGGVALIPFGLFLAARVRDREVYTLPDILKRAYGNRVAVPAGVVIAVSWCGVIAAQMIAGGRLLGGIFPLSFQQAVALVAVVFVLYTFWGGQVSVIRTDLWQLVLFISGLLVALTLLLVSYETGAFSWADIPADHWRFPVSPSFGWYDVLIFYPLVLGLPYLVGPDLYSRVLCARDSRVARSAALWAATVVVPVSFLLALMGLLIGGAFPNLTPEAALPAAISHFVPVGLRGLIIVGFLGAVMSSADTTLMSAATILSVNVIGPLAGLSKQKQWKLTRVALVAIGGAAWLLAGFQQGIIASLVLAFTIIVGGVAAPTLASLFPGQFKVTPNGAMWAVGSGGALAVLSQIQDGLLLNALLTERGDALLLQILGPQYPSILPVVLSFVVMMAVSRIKRPDR